MAEDISLKLENLRRKLVCFFWTPFYFGTKCNTQPYLIFLALRLLFLL